MAELLGQLSYWNTSYTSVYGNIWKGQTFSLNDSASIEYIIIKARRRNTASNVTVSIYTVDGSGFPDVLLGSKTEDASGWSTSFEDYTFILSSAIEVTTDTYALVVNHAGGDSSNCIRWQTYTIGTGGLKSTDGGSTWIGGYKWHDLELWGEWILVLPEKVITPYQQMIMKIWCLIGCNSVGKVGVKNYRMKNVTMCVLELTLII